MSRARDLANIADGNITGSLTLDGLNLGDNDKATFGDAVGGDLQIFHDAGNSRIVDAGTGNLNLQADNNINILNNAGTEFKAQFITGGAVNLFHANAKKFETTASGIDVTGTVTADGIESTCAAGDGNLALQAYHPTSTSTRDIAKFQSNVGGTQVDQMVIGCDGNVDINGTVTADGLTVSGATEFQDNPVISNDSPELTFETTNASHTNWQIAAQESLNQAFEISSGQQDADASDDTWTKRFTVKNDGDISFYDSTGVTQGFFWDASSQRLGVGTTSPSALLHLAANAPYITFEDKDNNQDWQLQATAWFALRNQTTNSELLRVTSGGNVGIGTDSPSTLMHLSSTSPRITLTDTNTGADHRINADSGVGNLAFDIDVNSETASPSAVFNIKGSEAMRIDSSGTVTATAFVGDGSGLTGLGGGFAAGTLMLFQQTAAPTGWTKQTTHNDKALRVVSGTAGSGGSVAFTTALATPAVSGSVSVSGNISDTTLSTAQMPSHNHGLQTGQAGNNVQDRMRRQPTSTQSSVNTHINATGGGGSHNHGHNFSGSLSSATTAINVQYVDLIIASKD